jgi:ATP-dependent Clp protease adapter protein ClpS
MNLIFLASLVIAVCGALAFQQKQSRSSSRHSALAFRPTIGRAWGTCATTSSSSSSSGDSSVLVLAAGPAVIEKEQVRTAGPAVLDRPETQRREKIDSPVKERVREGGEAWEVRIYNDGMNTREHVARSLVQITGMTEMTAYQTMMQAHQNGIASVGRFCFEIAEMYNEGLRKQGIISDIVPVDEEK